MMKLCFAVRKVKRHYILFLFLFLETSGAIIYAADALFLGIGPEVNAYSRTGPALGVNAAFGMEFDKYFTTGLKAGFFHNLHTVSVLDFQLLFRYYIPLIRSSLSFNGLFIQVESGGVFAFEYGEPFPSFSAGFSAGWRFNMPRDWYAEPTVRFGYPYFWGIEIITGYKFKMRGKTDEK